MRLARRAGLIAVQYLFGIVAVFVYAFGAETGWQRWVVPIAVTFAVWGVGALAAAGSRRFTAGRFAAKLATTALGAGLAFSFTAQFAGPLHYGAAAIIGFYVIPERREATPPQWPPTTASERGPSSPESPESSVSR